MNWLTVLGLSSNLTLAPAALEKKNSSEVTTWSEPVLAWKKDVTPDQDNATNVENSAIALWKNELYF